MLKESSSFAKENDFRFEKANLIDIYLLQETLKTVYGKSPWSYAIFWSELTKKSDGLYLKMLQDKTFIGFIGIRIDGTEAHITNLAILPNFQNKGFGSLLLEQGLLFAKAKKCLTLSLEVKKSNIPAIALYEKFGFFVTGVKEKYYKENQEDALDMVYVLDE